MLSRRRVTFVDLNGATFSVCFRAVFETLLYVQQIELAHNKKHMMGMVNGKQKGSSQNGYDPMKFAKSFIHSGKNLLFK